MLTVFLLIHRETDFIFLSNSMEYDRNDSFPFDREKEIDRAVNILLILMEVDFIFLSNSLGYDRADNFPFDYEMEIDRVVNFLLILREVDFNFLFSLLVWYYRITSRLDRVSQPVLLEKLVSIGHM